jgi:hypothetical protein
VQEITRLGVPIGVLNDNVQGLQQQLDEHATTIGSNGARMERFKNSFATFHTILEERLPPMQPDHPGHQE